jgi:hypothetical protein
MQLPNPSAPTNKGIAVQMLRPMTLPKTQKIQRFK